MSAELARAVTIVADDFGLDPAINRGVLRSYREGPVSGASLIVTSEARKEAVAMASDEDIPIGLHLSMIQEEPLSRPDEIPSLIGEDGQFHAHYTDVIWELLRGGIDFDELEHEFRKQFEYCVERGLKPLFVNSHEHVHLLPGVFGVVKKLAGEFDVPYIRTVDELLFPGRWSFLDVPVFGVKTLSKCYDRSLKQEDWMTSDWFSGVYLVETPGQDDWGRFVTGLPEGLTEIGVHVATEDVTGQYGIEKPRELETMMHYLCSGRLDHLLEDRGLELRSMEEVIHAS